MKRMKHAGDVVLLFWRFVLGPSMLALMSSVAYGLTVDRVLAIVNNEVITLSDYKKQAAKNDADADREKVNEAYLRRMIEEKLILQEARKAGIDTTEKEISLSIEDFMKQIGISRQELEKRLTDEGTNMTEYRQLLKENIMSLKIIDKEVDAKVVVGAGDVRQFYETNKDLFLEAPEKVLIKAIYLKLSDNASVTEITDLKIKSLKIYDEIKKGALFDMIAMKYKEIQGEFERGMLIPVLDYKIFSMKEGEVSEPVWTKDGVYIIKAVKTFGKSYKPFETAREDIRQKLYERRREEKYNEWVKSLWERSSVSIR